MVYHAHPGRGEQILDHPAVPELGVTRAEVGGDVALT